MAPVQTDYVALARLAHAELVRGGRTVEAEIVHEHIYAMEQFTILGDPSEVRATYAHMRRVLPGEGAAHEQG